MPLGKSTVFVPLGKGLRRDYADLVLPIGEGTLGLLNAYIDRTGQIVKRKGATALVNTTTAGGTISTSWQLATYKEALTSIGYSGGTPIAVYSPDAQKWAASGTGGTVRSGLDGPVATTETPINRSGSLVSSVYVGSDVAIGSGYILVGYERGPGNSVFDLIDQVSGQKVQTYEKAGTTHPHCVFISGHAIGLTIGATGLTMVDFNLSTIGTTPTETILSALAVDPVFDATTTTGGGFAVAFKDAGGNLLETLVTSGLAFTTYTVKDAAAATVVPNLMFTYVLNFGGGTARSIVSFDTTNGARSHFNLTTSGGNQQAVTTTVLYAGAEAKTATNNGATAYNTSTGAATIEAVWEYIDAVGTVPQIWKGISGTGTMIYKWAKLASKAWKQGSVNILIWAGDSLFAVRPDWPTGTYPAPLATAYRESAYPPGRGYQSQAASSSNSFMIALTDVTEVEAVASSVDLIRGASTLTLSYPVSGTVAPVGRPVEAIDSLFVATGGQLCQFDGKNYGEVGSPYAPEIISITPGALGSMTAGATYRYQTVFVRRDNNGNVWRSAPSLPFDVTLGGGDGHVDIVFKYLNLSGWDPSTLSIEIYRSAANESEELTLITQQANSINATSGTITDSRADSDIASALPLYTEGGILQADALPPTSLVLNALNRLWIVDAGDPTRLWPSTLFVDGQGPRFSEDTVINLREVDATPITALAALDDRVVVFKKGRIYVISGDGPDAAGNGGFNIATVAIGIGTENPQSVVTFMHGVIFKGGSSYQMLDRGLSVSSPIPGTTQIGQPLRDLYNALQISAAVNIAQQNQVRLYSIAGFTLVLDYVSWAWSVYELQPANTATVWRDLGAYWNGAVYAESNSSYLEGAAIYTMGLSTPWVSMAQVGGYERLYRIQGVGLTRQDHTIHVSMFINGDADTDVGINKSRLMQATEVVWAWELRPRIEKVSSFQLVMFEVATGDSSAMAVTGISLIVGIKQGLRKLYAPTARLT